MTLVHDVTMPAFANSGVFARFVKHRRFLAGSRPVAGGLVLAAGLVLGASVLVGPVQAASVAKKFAKHASGAGQIVDHSQWDKLLKTYVVKAPAGGLNRVQYRKFKSEAHRALKAYLAMLQKVDPGKLAKNEQFAFWANLYNAKTIDVVLDKYPVTSIKKIRLGGSLFASITGGPWKAKIMKVNGTKLSLDDIEHGILRPIFKDPRVHYAVNCASVGCPNLGAEAFTGAKLEAQLNRGAAAYINSPRGFKVTGGRVAASGIYKWFNKDFGGNEAGVLRHALKYAAPGLKAKLKAAHGIAKYDYDWALNDAK